MSFLFFYIFNLLSSPINMLEAISPGFICGIDKITLNSFKSQSKVFPFKID
jgi:hypothetical protein